MTPLAVRSVHTAATLATTAPAVLRDLTALGSVGKAAVVGFWCVALAATTRAAMTMIYAVGEMDTILMPALYMQRSISTALDTPADDLCAVYEHNVFE